MPPNHDARRGGLGEHRARLLGRGHVAVHQYRAPYRLGGLGDKIVMNFAAVSFFYRASVNAKQIDAVLFNDLENRLVFVSRVESDAHLDRKQPAYRVTHRAD